MDRPPHEVGDHVPVASGDLTRTVDVEIPGYRDRQTIVIVEIVAIELSNELVYLIRRVEAQRHEVLLQGQWRLAPVDRATRGSEDELFYTRQVSILEYSERAQPIDQQVGLRMIYTVLVGEMRSQMEYAVGLVREGALEPLLV